MGLSEGVCIHEAHNFYLFFNYAGMNECFGLSGEEADYTQESPWWERAVCTLMLDKKQQPYITMQGGKDVTAVFTRLVSLFYRRMPI